MDYLGLADMVSHDDQIDHALRSAALRLLTSSNLLLHRECKKILVLERNPEGLILEAICQRGLRSGFAGVDPGKQLAVEKVFCDGVQMIDVLAQVWPSYAIPLKLGIITDGEDIYFSPDRPSVTDPDWLTHAVWGRIRTCSLFAHGTRLSQLLKSERMETIH